VLTALRHPDEVLDAAYTPHTAGLLTGSADGVLTSWDLTHRRPPRRYDHGLEVYEIAVHPRQPGTVATVASDGALRIVHFED